MRGARGVSRGQAEGCEREAVRSARGHVARDWHHRLDQIKVGYLHRRREDIDGLIGRLLAALGPDGLDSTSVVVV